MQQIIDSFKGKYDWLSNMYHCHVFYDGLTYQSSEHAYVASKYKTKEERKFVAMLPTGYDAKRFGRTFTNTNLSFPKMKRQYMLDILRDKFDAEVLKKWLLDTGDALLIEGNNWGDTYWGVCDGVGQNHLGKILMQVRNEKAIELFSNVDNGNQPEYK